MTTPDPTQDTSLSSPDPTKLADWLPILQLPEVGERVCRAAGVGLEDTNDCSCGGVSLGVNYSTGFCLDDTLDPPTVAALAFGGLSLWAEESNGEYPMILQSPSAVLAALYRVYGPFGDGG